MIFLKPLRHLCHFKMSVTPGIVKKVLHSGTGLLPTYNQNTKVFFNFEVLLPLVDVNKEGFPEDRLVSLIAWTKVVFSALYKIIDDTRKSWPNGYGKPLELVFGKKFQLPVFETCITSMHTKEVSQFDIEANLMAPYPLVSKKLRDIARAEIDKNFDFNASQHHHCVSIRLFKQWQLESKAAMGPFRWVIRILTLAMYLKERGMTNSMIFSRTQDHYE